LTQSSDSFEANLEEEGLGHRQQRRAPGDILGNGAVF
jgi:hypothetical protein